jgi:adenine phosphoribosyltransferase
MDLAAKLRHVMDFPKPGIDFVDITTLLRDGAALRAAIEALDAAARSFGEIDVIVSPEARGFIFGMPLAYRMGKGFVPVRKPGKLPAKTVSLQYDLEYGTECVEIHADALAPGTRALVVDDLLATGGTSRAIIKLLETMGVRAAGLLFLIELQYLGGVRNMSGLRCESVIKIER